MTLMTPPGTDLPEAPVHRRLFDEELIIKEARRRQKRRWLVMGLVVAMTAAIASTAAVVVLGGHGKTGTSPRSDGGTKKRAPPFNGVIPASVAFSHGTSPTPIYFLNADQGWIAVGCGSFCYQYRPAILRTSDGGRTWRVAVGPDIGSVPFSGPTWMALGGQTEVRFLDARRGFYTQVGELWTTGDGGSTWHLMDTGGPVISLATLGNSALALVSHCPRFPLSCSQVELYRWSTTSPTWARLSTTFSTGRGDPTDASLTVAANSVFVSVPGHQYRIDLSGRIASVSTACWAIQGPPTPGQLVGICLVNGGGDASKVAFAVSRDHGETWTPTIGAPPSHGTYNWSGVATTNGRGVIWYVVGGGTLWRTSTHQKQWAQVYATQSGSDEELYPVVFASSGVGFMGETGNEAVQLLKTTDTGLNWASITGTIPKGSSLEPPSNR